MRIRKWAWLLSLLGILLFSSCSDEESENLPDLDFRKEMRDFVIEIAAYAREENPDFIVIPQNGHELLTQDGEPGGPPAAAYVQAIDGAGQEDLFYGYEKDDRATPEKESAYLQGLLDVGKENGVSILVTDYCSDAEKMNDSYIKNEAEGYVSFAADSRELDRIPAVPAAPYNENDRDVEKLTDVRNFLYLINPERYASKTAFLSDLSQTNYDLLIIDAFFKDGSMLSKEDVDSLKRKANGGKRLVVSYMSIGEAEDYRDYWKSEWLQDPPSWLEDENPEWKGNYKVRYWEEEWKKIIFGQSDSYLDRIQSAGFDGVYLDIIEAFETFE